MNQLLILLNTAVAEHKQMKTEFDDMGDYGGGLAEGMAEIGRHADERETRRPVEKADSIEYEHGSLGIVPRSADDV